MEKKGSTPPAQGRGGDEDALIALIKSRATMPTSSHGLSSNEADEQGSRLF